MQTHLRQDVALMVTKLRCGFRQQSVDEYQCVAKATHALDVWQTSDVINSGQMLDLHVVQVMVYASNISHNQASVGGGGVFVGDNSKVWVYNSHLEGNTAPAGGAMQAGNNAQV